MVTASQEEWQPIFNGKSLEGWDTKIKGHLLNDNYKNTFRVTDGYLTTDYDQYDSFDRKFGHLFYEEPFSYYKLKVEYRFVKEQVKGGPGWAFRNNGLMLHCQSAASMGVDQDFPISIEVQLLGGSGEGERSTANLCTPGTNIVMNGELVTAHCINSSSKTYHGDQWVSTEVIVMGSESFTHVVEGDTVLYYTDTQIGGGNVSNHDPTLKEDGRLLSSGYISIQGESHPTQFRKIEVLNLEGCMDKKAKNYKSYFVKNDPSKCSY